MSTLKATNLQHASATSPAIVLASDGTAAATVSSLNGGPLSGARNRIINGDMRIDQRNAIITANNTYTVDRWQLSFATTGAVQVAKSSAAAATFSNSLLFDVTTADTSIAAGEYAVLAQLIEGLNTADLAWGSASAQTVTLSFWINSTTTGTYCVSLRNSAINRSYVAEYSVAVANTWEKKTITIPGDTSGTWLADTGIGLAVSFAFASGSTYQTTANAWAAGNFLATSNQVNLLASAANEARITGVQLEAGTVATPFERRSYGQELALCQRYYFKDASNSVHVWSGKVDNAATYYATRLFPVTMRANPTCTVTSGGESLFTSARTVQTQSIDQVQWSATTGASAGNGYFLTGITASIEL